MRFLWANYLIYVLADEFFNPSVPTDTVHQYKDGKGSAKMYGIW